VPEGIVELLITALGILFFFIIPLGLRARNAAQRREQAGGPRPALRAERPAAAEPETGEEELSPGWPRSMRPAPRELSPVPVPPAPAEAAAPAVPAPSAPSGPPPAAWAMMPGLRPAAESFPPAATRGAPEAAAPRGPRLTALQRAVVWAEILGPPRGLEERPPQA